jgi:hypothetical protein
VEAVPATIGARRTVRLAAALVVGQVFLVAIVGWMTLTRPGDRPAAGASGVDRMAAPPAWIAPAREPSSGKPSSTGPAESARAHTTEQAPADPINPTSTSVGPTQSSGHTPIPPIPLVPFGAADSAPSNPLGLTPPSSGTATSPKATPSPSAGPGSAGAGGSGGTGGSGGLGVSGSASPTPGTVLAGRPCDHWGVLARADDGRMVRCLPGRYYRLRWKIV